MSVWLRRLVLLSAFACAAPATLAQGAELPKKPLHQHKSSGGHSVYLKEPTRPHRSAGAVHYPSHSRHHFHDPRQPSFHSFGPAFMR